MLFINNQIPKLVLQDDGHFFRITFFQIRGDNDIRMIGSVRYIKMMFSRQAIFGRIAQKIFDHR